MEIRYSEEKGMIDVLADSTDLCVDGFDFKLHVIVLNRIEGIINPVISELNGQMKIRYRTQGRENLKSMLDVKRPYRTFIEKLFLQVVKCISSVENYMLDKNDLLIDEEYIFWDEEKQNYCFAYVPGYDRNIYEQMKTIVEKFMRIMDHSDRNGVMYVYEMYDRLALGKSPVSVQKNDESQRSSKDCAKKITEKKCEDTYENFTDTEGEEDVKNREKGNPLFVIGGIGCALFGALFYVIKRDFIIMLVLEVAGGLLVSKFCKMHDEDEDADRAMLEYEIRPEKLVPLDNLNLPELSIDENRKKILIGRCGGDIDYCIGETSVSREHAMLHTDGERLFLQDMNSTNGTYLNYEKISSGESYSLKKGDIISFANEKFIVK